MRQALKLALEALEDNRQTHHYCEDTWYSCPKHEEGCANESEGDECNCGADKANAEIDQAVTAIKEALAQPEQEPVACIGYWNQKTGAYYKPDQISMAHQKLIHDNILRPCYTTPPQRKPLTDEQKMALCKQFPDNLTFNAIHAIETAHGIKE